MISVGLKGFFLCLKLSIYGWRNDTLRGIHVEKSVSVPSDPPQIPLRLTRIQIRSSLLKGKTLSPWAVACSLTVMFSCMERKLSTLFRSSQEIRPTGKIFMRKKKFSICCDNTNLLNEFRGPNEITLYFKSSVLYIYIATTALGGTR